MSALQDLVDRRMIELDLGVREVERRSGGRASKTTVSNIRNGRHKGKVSDEVLEGLSAALEVPVSRLAEAAHRSGYQPRREYELPERAHRLDPLDWEVLISTLDSLLDRAKRREERDGS